MTESRRALLAKLAALPLAVASLSKLAVAKISFVASSDTREISQFRSLGRNILRFVNTAQA